MAYVITTYRPERSRTRIMNLRLSVLPPREAAEIGTSEALQRAYSRRHGLRKGSANRGPQSTSEWRSMPAQVDSGTFHPEDAAPFRRCFDRELARMSIDDARTMVIHPRFAHQPTGCSPVLGRMVLRIVPRPGQPVFSTCGTWWRLSPGDRSLYPGYN
jgi:hypothetical protein